MSDDTTAPFVNLNLSPGYEPAEAEQDDGKKPCPECGLRFLPPGLAIHRRSKHGVPTEASRFNHRDMMTCPQEGCGAQFQKGSAGRHLREVHGVYGGVSGKPRGRPKAKFKKEKAKKVEKVEAVATAPPTAEEIAQTTVEMLWPDSVPTEHMGALMTWYMQTADFLRAVRNGTE